MFRATIQDTGVNVRRRGGFAGTSTATTQRCFSSSAGDREKGRGVALSSEPKQLQIEGRRLSAEELSQFRFIGFGRFLGVGSSVGTGWTFAAGIGT